MKYLSLYKTQSEHSSDNSRLIPNISLITDDKKLILTNENNIGTTFEEVDIIESFDDIINRFPTGNSTGMPGLKIYMDDSKQSKAKNIKLVDNARQWRSNYIQNNGLSDTGQEIRINVDAVLMDNIIMDKYDGKYNYWIHIYNNSIELFSAGGSNFLTISGNGSVTNNLYNIFPSPTETKMPYLNINSNISNNSNNIYENLKIFIYAQKWRKDYILYNGLSDTGQPIKMFVDKLYIDDVCMDEYNRYYYYIDIYNDRIILLNEHDSSEVLTISRNGSVTILDIFNIFPYPKRYNQYMLGLKIYTDNTDQSKAENIKFYNDARQWRDNYIINEGSSDTNQGIEMGVNALVIDDETFDEYDREYRYGIDIYKDHITLIYNVSYSSEMLTISDDGSVSVIDLSPTLPPSIFNEFPTKPNTYMPGIKIYTDKTEESKANNIELYNNAQEYRNNYLSSHPWMDPNDKVSIGPDVLIIDDETIDEYDGKYRYGIDIYNDHITLIYNNNRIEILNIFSDGSVRQINPIPIDSTTTISPTTTI